MFPLKSMTPSGSFPFVTLLLALTNVLVFVYIWNENLSSVYLLDFGIVPGKLGMPSDVVSFYDKVYPFFTYMFLHGGWFHLIVNVYFLYVFGASVENRLGHWRYFVCYIAFGLIAAMVYVVLSPTMSYPMVGASGAIAGIMGAYLVFYPTAKIKTLLIIIIFITIVNVPAIVFIGLWFAMQVLNVFFSGTGFMDGGVAWWAHIGGFGAGILFALAVRIFSLGKNNTASAI